jgi:hypothetical protein
MDRESGLSLQMGTATDEFNVAHPDTDAGYIVSANRLTQLVERGRGLAATQREGRIEASAAVSDKRVLRRAMMAGPIAHLSGVGKFAASENSGLGISFVFSPSGDTEAEFRTAAGTMAAAAHTHKELLVKYGLSESVLDLFVQLLDKFDSAVSRAASGRATQKAATKALTSVAKEIRRTVRVMDARNRLRFQNDPELLGQWISVSRVSRLPRVSSSGDTPSRNQDSGLPGGGASPPGSDVEPAA